MIYNTRNKEELSYLDPIAKDIADRVYKEWETNGEEVLITDAYRSNDEQDALYAKGRTEPGPVVTNASGGYSLHNYGVAIDIVPITPNGEADWSDYDSFERLANVAKKHGMEWGGDWTSFPDAPHLQYTQGHDVTYFLNGGTLSPSEEPSKSAWGIVRYLSTSARIRRLRRAIQRSKGLKKKMLQNQLERLLRSLKLGYTFLKFPPIIMEVTGTAIQVAFILGFTNLIGRLIKEDKRDALLPFVAVLLGLVAVYAPNYIPEQWELISQGVALGGTVTGMYPVVKSLKR